MQQTSIAPEAKAALARCFAAHKALRSYSADVLVTARGVPKEKEGRLKVAFARPGRARFECVGPRASARGSLLIAANSYIYEAFPSGAPRTSRVPFEADALVVACEDTGMFLFPTFSQLMVGEQGLSEAIAAFPTMTQLPGKLVFQAQGEVTLTLTFDPRDLLLREVHMTQGTSIELREVYQNVRANPVLPSALWRFDPARMQVPPVKEKSIL